MGWSRSQQTMLLKACTDAGIASEQRYSILRWVGCPVIKIKGKQRPSVKDDRNTNRQFDAAMEIIEAHARAQGVTITPPRKFSTWAEACAGETQRTVARIERIAANAQRTVGKKGDWSGDIVPGLVRRHTVNTPALRHAWEESGSLDGLDLGTVLKVLRALEAMVRREHKNAGLAPPDFEARRTA